MVDRKTELEKPPREKDFSNWYRELRDTVDPVTGERVLLLTRKQIEKLRLKELKDFGDEKS